MYRKDRTQPGVLAQKLQENYADIYDELEDVMFSFEIISAEIDSAMDDICDELERLQEQLDKCRMSLIKTSRMSTAERIAADSAIEEWDSPFAEPKYPADSYKAKQSEGLEE